MADRIDSVGGELETGLGRDLSFAHVVVMKDSLALGHGPAGRRPPQPGVRPGGAGAAAAADPVGAAGGVRGPRVPGRRVFDRLVYGYHPYGLPGNGTVESVRAITRDDLAAFHRRYFVPNNCLLAVVGDITVEEAMAAATRAFGDWERREVPADAALKLPDPADAAWW